MFGIVQSIKSIFPESEDKNSYPPEDLHGDEDAQVGDRRIKVIPNGEIFGYDSSVNLNEFDVRREVYTDTAEYSNGNVSYQWYPQRNIFHGDEEKWNEVKNNPKQYFDDIPANWPDIVEHVDNFLEIHGNHLDEKEYPHSVLEIE